MSENSGRAVSHGDGAAGTLRSKMKNTFSNSIGRSTVALACAAAALLSAGPAQAAGKCDTKKTPAGTGNPYLPLWEHVPDGEPRVFEDPDRPGHYRLYLIGSHDTRLGSYCGADVRMWSAPVDSLTAWRDEGPVFTYRVQNQWDVMYAPDIVEVRQKDGSKVYYLYPHSRGSRREAMVCKGTRPDGPFTPVNLNAEGTATVPGSILGFDPSVYVEPVTDPADPDYALGFRAWGFWGFQRSSAAQLDQRTMYSVRPGTEIIPYFIPACTPDGRVRDPKGTAYPALYKGQKPEEFGFFEASSIRKVGNKYVMIFSGYSGKEYGMGNTNSTLRYAYGDSPVGPWRSGGVLVDSRGVVPSLDGSRLAGSNAAHNTHGSLQEVNGQWYVFYHRPPRNFGYARQAMVAPVTVRWDTKAVADGGRVVIRGYNPYAADSVWTARAADGHEYTGAEVTSEGFQIFGLDPYKYYSAGYACYLSDVGSQQDSWDNWDNSMPIRVKGGSIIGYKYFGFGGLDRATKGLQPFAGTRKGNNTRLNLFIEPATDKAFSVEVWLDGPVANATWQGRKLGTVDVPARSARKVTRFQLDVAGAVDGLGGKHAVFLVVNGQRDAQLCTLHGLGFTAKGQRMDFPAPPAVSVSVGGKAVSLPAVPEPSTTANGYTDNTHYATTFKVAPGTKGAPKVTAKASSKDVRVKVTQPASARGTAIVECDYKGARKVYTIKLE